MLNISKYEGLGNDFIICKDEDLPHKDYSKLALELCNNSLTGSTDGLICVKTNPLTMIFYNKDGSIGTMCGNGLRSFIKYCYDNNIIQDLNNDVITKAGIYKTKIISINPFLVEANMGKPDYSTATLKINSDKEEYLNEVYSFGGADYYLNCIFMGTHHTVIYVNDVENISEELGFHMCHLPIFDDRTNVDFVQIVSESHLKVRTYERGVGFTLACGTGACASFCVSRKYKKCSSEVFVEFKKGSLKIKEEDESVIMIGPATLINTWKYSFNK